MILIKDGIKRTLDDKETIAIFKDAGWEEFTETKKEEIKEQPKSKKKNK